MNMNALPVAPPRPLVRQHPPERDELKRWSRLASAMGICRSVTTTSTIDGRFYVGCDNGTVALADPRTWRPLRVAKLQPSVVSGVRAAGNSAIAVAAWRDGAALVNDLYFLNSRTLKQINKDNMSDTLFLGVIGNRAYLDDLCCFGRADQYRPATVYSMSLEDGSTTEPVDLAPDAKAHPPDREPLGQGETSYLIGKYFYLVVNDVRYIRNLTYRYDITNLRLPPVRMKTYETPAEAKIRSRLQAAQ